MTKKLKRILILSLISIAIIAEIAFLWVRHRTQGTPPSEIITRVLHACVAPDRSSFDPACFRRTISGYIRQDSIGPLVESLGNIFESEQAVRSYAILTCHTPAHIIGELAVSKGMTFPTVVQSCSKTCDYGCIHGALNMTLRGEKQFMEKFPALCDAYAVSSAPKDKASCAHVIGHAIAETYHGDAIYATAQCDKFGDPENRMNCGQGAVMQFVFGSLDRPDRFSGDAEALYSFCRSLPGIYRNICFDGLGAYSYRLYTDTSLSESLCARVPKESAANCYQSLGVWAYFEHATDPDGLIAYCSRLGSQFAMPCMRGAITNTVNMDKSNTYALSLCRAVPPVYAKDCFSHLGNEYSWAYGQAERTAYCNALQPDEASYCLNTQPGQGR